MGSWRKACAQTIWPWTLLGHGPIYNFCYCKGSKL